MRVYGQTHRCPGTFSSRILFIVYQQGDRLTEVARLGLPYMASPLCHLILLLALALLATPGHLLELHILGPTQSYGIRSSGDGVQPSMFSGALQGF